MEEKESRKFCRCLRCNRILKSEEAKEKGYGPKCWREHKLESQRNRLYLFKVYVN